MLQVTYKSSPYIFYVSTEGNRIATNLADSKIRFLFKLINDMSGAFHYGYGQSQTIYDRYTKMQLVHNTTEDVFTGAVDLVPNGYWTYEIYEVGWIGTPALTSDFAPATETQVLPVDNANGVVKGLVNQGKLYVTEESGQEQVQYTQYERTKQTNYIYYGQ
jgi:hypothetical protein